MVVDGTGETQQAPKNWRAELAAARTELTEREATRVRHGAGGPTPDFDLAAGRALNVLIDHAAALETRQVLMEQRLAAVEEGPYAVMKLQERLRREAAAGKVKS